MKFLVIIGTRPEAIKLAPVVLELERRGAEALIAATGQHNVTEALALFGLEPYYTMSIEQEPDRSLNTLAAAVVSEMDYLLSIEQRPTDCVIVQGDTTSAMAGALAAFYRRVPVAHVEAGLRTWNIDPYPEEMNRRIIDQIADYNFPPTEIAYKNLATQQMSSASHPTGNTGIDALHYALDHLPAVQTDQESTVLVTAHRRENWHKIEDICEGINLAAACLPECKFYFLYHMNPAVSDVVKAYDWTANVTLLPPQDYFQTIDILRRSNLVITDSGGLQEEAAALGVPCLVMRTFTERPEAIRAGLATLIGTDTADIVYNIIRAIESDDEAPPAARTLYGDGHAAERIVDILLRSQ